MRAIGAPSPGSSGTPTRPLPAARRAALGLRCHSGGAALVAVAEPATPPPTVLRRRIKLSRATPRQPYHAAEGRPLAEAEPLLRAAADETAALLSVAAKAAF